MKRYYKILKIAVILILSVVFLLFSVSLLMQNKVAGLLIKTLNRNFETKIEAGSYRLSLLKKFPKATIELKNVLVHSSPTFDKGLFGKMNTDTLLSARSALLDFKMMDLLKGEYTFEGIAIKSGRLNLYTDTAGHYNYVIAGQASQSKGSHYSLNLNRINLSGISVLYHDLNLRLIIKGMVNSSRDKCRITEKEIDFGGVSDVEFRYFKLKGYTLTRPFDAKLEVGVNRSRKGYFFRKSTMHLREGDLILNGYIAADNYFDLIVTGNGLDFSGIGKYVPLKASEKISEFRPAGNLSLVYTVKGKSSKRVDPHYDLSFSLKNGRISRPGSGLKLEKLSFSGAYSNGNKNLPLTSTFTIDNFNAKLGSAIYKGSFHLADFTRPNATLTFKGTIYPEEMREFFDLRKIKSAEGTIDLDINLAGLVTKKSSYSLSDLLVVNSRTEISFNSFGMKLADRSVELKNANGKVLITETTTANNFRFWLNGQKITMDFNLRNFPEWISGAPVNLEGNINMNATGLKPESFSSKARQKDTLAVAKAPLVLPQYVDLNVNFSIDTLVYKTFNAEKISGTVSFKPRIANFRTISLNSQKGKVSGNGLVFQNSDKSLLGRASFTVSDVDVNEAFRTFHNFGQNFLKAENIAGSLSGTLTLLLPVDSLLKPKMSLLTAEGKYILTNGALVNFDPVKALSTFISLSELENIKFDKLENNFFIRNNYFYVPQMEVRSSAVDLSVNGKHSFDNYYQYHVKMHLSEILSNKARKNRTLSSEFGEVEDDGLGRTSVFLKVEGKGEDVKVSYDLKAAGEQVKNDIKKEKQNLKNILNEEYGWYGSDSTAIKKQAPKRRFRISWEGSDTTAVEPETHAVKKEGIIQKIFKKK
jgi:hypothetical protein